MDRNCTSVKAADANVKSQVWGTWVVSWSIGGTGWKLRHCKALAALFLLPPMPRQSTNHVEIVLLGLAHIPVPTRPKLSVELVPAERHGAP